MPTYDYRCPRGHLFEVFQRISEKPEATCPDCGEPAQRQISAGAGFLFKGEGFYVTDYRSADYRKKASSDGDSPPAAQEGSRSGGDKPAKPSPPASPEG